DIAHHCEKNGGGNVVVVSHGLTIAVLLNLSDPKQPVRAGLLNGSVTKDTNENGRFTIHGINDSSYIDNVKTHSRDT
ncbi:histidine phosphatase family protein, partial [Enterococcus faecium]|uniref:histidine phosphatase family protein n=1 Tax=Enterococcus faecium TaxID=1352 RepID=UPI003CC61260